MRSTAASSQRCIQSSESAPLLAPLPLFPATVAMRAASAPPGARVGTKYRTYKAATEKLARWLASTAPRLGDVDCALIKGDDGHPSSKSSYGLRIAQFSTMTDQIVEATPKIEVPFDIVTSAQTAFHARQERAALLRGINVDSDIRHQFVISTIADVFGKLKRHYQASKKPAGEQLPYSDETLVPFFQLLDLEPLDSGAESDGGAEGDFTRDAPPIKLNKNKKEKLRKKKKRAREASKHFYLEEEDEDPYFVLVCLLSDLQSMRAYIKQLWNDYKHNQVDLITASLTTNAAFDILRTYEEDFPTIALLLGDYRNTIRLILSRTLDDESSVGLRLFFKPCTELFETPDIETVGSFLSSIPQIADLTFATAFYFLNGPRHSIVRRSDCKEVHTVLNDHFGTYDSSQDRAKLSAVEKLKQDVQVLARFAKNVFNVDTIFSSIHDHLTMQWTYEYVVNGNKTISLSQAFGAQIFLDMHHVLQDHVYDAYHDISKAALQIKATLEYWRQPGGPSHEIKHSVGQGIGLLAVESIVDTIIKGMEYEKHIGAKTCCCHLRKELAFRDFLEIHPLLCGITLFKCLHAVRNSGMYLAHYSGSIKCAGQFYYACHMHRTYWKTATEVEGERAVFQQMINEKWKEPLVWEDMQSMIDMLGVEAFFDGRIPKSNNDVYKFLGTVEDGMEMLGWKPKRKKEGHSGPIRTIPGRSKDLPFAKHTFLTFEPIAVTHRLFHTKYACFKPGKMQAHLYGWKLETLQALLEDELKKNSSAVEPKQESKSRGRGRKKPTTANPRSALTEANGEVSHVDILRTLREALEKESRALHFDFLSFHTTCYLLLSTMRSDLRQLMEEVSGRDGVDRARALTYRNNRWEAATSKTTSTSPTSISAWSPLPCTKSSMEPIQRRRCSQA